MAASNLQTDPQSYQRTVSKGMDKKLKNILQDISTKTADIKAKMVHVEPVVQTKMPQRLENVLCAQFQQFPITYTYKCPRFDVDDDAAYKHLDEYGYVVFKNVIPSNTEIEEIRTQIWDWLEQLSFPNEKKIDRDDPETWHDGNWPCDPDTGIVFSFGVGQARFMWRCRSYPKVHAAFSKAWGTSDLITSFDGCNLYRPWQYHGGWRTKGKWWHLDQNARRSESRGKQSIQGLLALTDGDETTGGLCVIPKTHLVHDQLCERVRWPSHSDYVPLPKKDRVFDDFRDVGGYLVHYKAGDLVVWDGRTVHCNSPSMDALDANATVSRAESAAKKCSLTRMVVYICFGPREKAKNEILKKRQQIAFNAHCTSTHWPHFFRYRLGAGVVGHGDFSLNEAQKRLVGYPRNAVQELIWQLKYEFELTWSDLATFGVVATALAFVANVMWKQRKQ
mmetsp:Transcript_15972/g.24552  ORF Transcript_15972/g.24552 Transcript_15972/m.24552 type:complete len:448 (+) Transcript_15972:41-1384(+)|eukprot:CAMPEP_0202690814 /NCGR_PEP_ID=MMETSP1385-20130828/5705_1 /ASSEMBLY_ACC=CAM_ASM_000861 /TAXON_ID=933848 /ORGANISM="Elphidium margaritaceum" /LENGTH=447 /DNA_ID=CAMNT_0049346121 /DNA_START=35 /DNA_END=1378 /DNA_ORIENTATION=+